MSASQNLAIVTGASSGIGAEISRHLKNESGLEIWLVARRRDRMESLAEELSASGAVVRVLALDLQKPEAWASLESEVKSSGRRVAWLVNNAGYGYSGLFQDETTEHMEGMIQLNIVALVTVTRRLLPYMVRGSHVVNIASAIAFLPVAGHAVYAATKAFVLSFSLALREEIRPQGISVSTVCPGPVSTEFWDLAGVDAPPKMLVEKAYDTAFYAVEKSAQGKAIILTGALGWVARICGALLASSWIAALTAKRLRG